MIRAPATQKRWPPHKGERDVNTGERKSEPTPGQNIRQRRALRDALIDHEIERADRLHAELQVDALLDRVRQPEHKPPVHPAITSAMIGLYFVILIGSAALALGWHTRAVQAFLEMLRSAP